MKPTWQSEDGRVKLWLGDCLEVMKSWGDEGVGAVVTDPPYGIDHESHGQIFASAAPINGDECLRTTKAVYSLCRDVPLVMFFSPYKPFGEWRSVLCWDKGAHMGIGGDRKTCWKRDFEMIGAARCGELNGLRDSAVLHFNGVQSSRHFCEKPESLMLYLIGKLRHKRINDPFMGSGTTGVAALRLGRQFWGVEIDPGYFEIAKDRIIKELSKQKRAFKLKPKKLVKREPMFEMKKRKRKKKS